MGSRNVWILLACVLLLGGVALWQLDRERTDMRSADVPLFDDVRRDRLRALRLDHVERGLQLALERDQDGAWQLVDPLAFPAEDGVLERLFETIERNRAVPVGDVDPAKVSLAPPRAVLELVEALPSGERTVRLELGARDDDGKHVYARVGGRIVRTLLNLDSTLDRDLSAWRRHRIVVVEPTSVVEVRRSGRLALDPAQTAVDLALEAGTTESGGWRATAPWNAALDPGVVGALLTNVCYLQARNFLADSEIEAAAFGLDQPEMRVELVVASGAEIALRFRRDPSSETWACAREGSTHVFRVDDVAVVYLAMPSDGFLDPKLVRAPREEIQRIELSRGEETLALRREGQAWLVGATGGALARAEVPADPDAVADLLGGLESGRAALFLIEERKQEFVPAQPPLAVRVTFGGTVLGVEFGAEHEAGAGVPGRMFRRTGEDVAGVVEAPLAELASREWAHFVDRQLVRLPEPGIAAIELARGELRRTYVRDSASGRWSQQGVDAEAPKDFLRCVDRLLSLRADVVVAQEAPFELRDPWSIALVDGAKIRTEYRLGELASDPAVHGYDDGQRRGIVTTSGLLPDLARIP